MKLIPPRFQGILSVLVFSFTIVLFSQQIVSAGIVEGARAYLSSDYVTALKEFRPLAEQGNAVAQYNLGAMYNKGQGVPQDDKVAVSWYRKAAEKGEAMAQQNLGVMYGNGHGVPQDYVRAHMWLNLAGAAGQEDAVKNRDIVEKPMTPSQIEEVQRLAREWKPSKSR